MRPSLKIGIFVIVCFAFTNGVKAQNELKPEKYTTWVHEFGQDPNEGFLRAASLDSLILSPELLPSNETGFRRFDVSDVATIKFRKNTSQGWGALIGLAAGATAGALMGAAIEGGDFCGGKCGGTQPGTLILLSGIGGAMIGATVGVGIGSKKKKVQLNGKMTNEQLKRILPYVNQPPGS